VKIRTLLSIALLPLLFSCAPPKPEIPMTDVPAAPLLKELDLRRVSFTGLKAAARVETERKGRKRAYESVAFLAKGQEKLRVEGFGPMGEPVFAMFWDGKDILLRMPGEAKIVRTGPWAFERLIGFPIAMSDLAAVLSGNVPPVPEQGDARARCTAEGRCTIEFRRSDVRWKVRVVPAEPFRIESCEQIRSGKPVFEARFESPESIGGYLFPKRIVVENADRSVSLTIEYQEVEVNVPVDDSAFILADEGATL
jgi:hypothetical protein